MKKKVKINFVDFWHPGTIEEIKNEFLFQILSQRFDLEISDQPDFLLYSCFGVSFLNFKCIRIFYTGENLPPNFNECDYAFTFEHLDHPRHHRAPLYALRDGDPQQLTTEKDVEAIFRDKSKFCNFVYSNSMGVERIKFFRALSRYKQIDSGGAVLNNIGYQIDNKLEFLKPYKFTIAFENESHPGYVTEKIWNAMQANTIPIYWGNPVVHQDFNPKSFINCHDYDSFEAVIDRVIEIDNNDDLYKQYLAEPYFHNNMVPQDADWNLFLDHFEVIFNRPNIKPVAQSWKNSRAKLKYLAWFQQALTWHRIPQFLRGTFFWVRWYFEQLSKNKENSGNRSYLQ